MALNFPPSTIGGNLPIDGDIWTDPETGRQWQFDGDVPGWKVTASPGPGVVYRGGIDLTVDPATQFTNITSGDFFAVTTGADPVSALYPGLAGQTIVAPGEVIFDGAEWQALGTFTPLASETVAGRIEIATQAEVDAGTANNLAVVPATLGNFISDNSIPTPPTAGGPGQVLVQTANGPRWQDLPVATEQVAGLIEIATQAEVNAGTSTTLAVTPATLEDAIELAVPNIATEIINLVTPAGTVIWSARTTPPAGYLVANGDVVPNSTGTVQGVSADFSALFQALGSNFGVAGQLPDLRGEFIRGADLGRGVDSGRVFGSHQGEGVNVNMVVDNMQIGVRDTNFTCDNQGAPCTATDLRGVSYWKSGQLRLSATISGDSAETRPRNVALLPCIKF